MDFRKRVGELERQAGPSGVITVHFFSLRHGDETQPYFVEYEGRIWTQLAGESLDVFASRVEGLARLIPAPTGRIFLCAKRPHLTRDQSRARWLEEQHGPDWKTIVGDA